MEIAEGKSYEIIQDTTHHLFKKGSIVEAIEVDERRTAFRAIGWVDRFAMHMDRWVNVEDVQKVVSEEEVQQAIASIKSAIH